MAMCLQPGDVCLFSSYVFHTSRPNRGPSPRCNLVSIAIASEYSIGMLTTAVLTKARPLLHLLRRVHYASWSLGPVCWGQEARREILRSMARRPTVTAPSRRYELLGSLLAPPRQPGAATSAATAAVPGRPGPPLMFAVPVRPEPSSLPPCLPPCLPLGPGCDDARKKRRKST